MRAVTQRFPGFQPRHVGRLPWPGACCITSQHTMQTLSIVTLPISACDPDRGVACINGLDFECSAPLDVYGPDDDSELVTVTIVGTVLPQHDTVRVVYVELP